MPVSLTAALLRERQSKNRPAPILPPSAYMLTGAELARECESAVRSYPPSRALTDAEREALAAMLAAVVTERMGRGRTREQVKRNGASRTPADVLRYVARCERFPALMAGREGIPRSAIGREYLRREVACIMRDSREWRDTAESYTTARERQADTGPMVRNVDTARESDALTAASAREVERSTGEPLPAMPLDSAEVSEAMAQRLAHLGASREAVGVALRMAAGIPLAAVALDLDVALVTAKRRSGEGAAWLRGCDRATGPVLSRQARNDGAAHCPACHRPPHSARIPAGDLISIMRECADLLGHVVPADPSAPMLPASAACAARAIERAERITERTATLAGMGCG